PTLHLLSAHWQRICAVLDESGDQYQSAVEEITRSMQATHASLLLLDEEQLALTRIGAVGLPPDHTTTPTHIGDGLPTWIRQHNCPLLWADDSEPPAFIREFGAEEPITSALCVPLLVEGCFSGALKLARLYDDPPFTPDDLGIAVFIADRIGLRVAHNRLISQLGHREHLIDQIVESIPSSLVVIDQSLRIVSANRNFLTKARRRAQATVECRLEEVFPHVLLHYTRLEQKIRDIFRTGQMIDGGKLLYSVPGVPNRMYYYRLVPLKVGERIQHVMLLMDDITEREQLGAEVRLIEQRLASVVESANDLVISLDPQGLIVTWNRAAEQVSGLTAEQVKGRSLVSLCAPAQRSVMTKLLRTCVTQPRKDRITLPLWQEHAPTTKAHEPLKRSSESIEVSLLTAEAQEVSIAWNASPMHDDAGQMTGIVILGRDLTEQQRMQAQLAQSSKMASLGVMAGGIGHELRNPLGIIASNAQLLDEYPNDAQLRSACVQKIFSATRRASLIIENLLKFARPQREPMRTVNLHSLLDDILPLIVEQLNQHHVRLIQEIAAGLPLVYGNTELLQQVCTNLIFNACHAMPTGGTLTISIAPDHDGNIEMQFRDTGCGIDPEHLPKIFDPFFTTMPVGRGTGLGLSISYSIIQHHSGTITATSQIGQGTTFTIRLPCSLSGPLDEED
ncbi:MAG: ATP-binding protein, partial [Chloroflexales bacterium]|nr:ATP-binding protein [Chloroflexales bacterium]